MPSRGLVDPGGDIMEVGWETHDQYVRDFLPMAETGLGFGDAIAKALGLGWIRFATKDDMLFVEGSPEAIEDSKFEILGHIEETGGPWSGRRVYVDFYKKKGTYGSEVRSEFSLDDFLSLDMREEAEHAWRLARAGIRPRIRRKLKRRSRGKGWWRDRGRHRLAARLGWKRRRRS